MISFDIKKYYWLLSKVPKKPKTPKVVIVSFYKSNTKSYAELQLRVVNHFNINHYEFLQIMDDKLSHDAFGNKFINTSNADIILFLDIDAFPVSCEAIDYYINSARNGILIGNVQRARYKNNSNHLYAGPSSMCFTAKLWREVGQPNMHETYRADNYEEFTYACENHGRKIELVPVYDVWAKKWWLYDNIYAGRGTIYGYPDKPMFFHLFQVRKGKIAYGWYKRMEMFVEKLINGFT